MKRLLLGLGAATLAGLCLWLARREPVTTVHEVHVTWDEPYGDC